MSLDKGTATAAVLSAESETYEVGAHGIDALQAEQRYGEEAAKRIRKEGNAQYIDTSLSKDKRFERFHQDVWADPSSIADLRQMFPEQRCRMLVLGAGFSGIQYAVRMTQNAGIDPSDLRIVDSAGGFGGTWYWNRYPGLTCDVESYTYLPLLEETAYVPKHRYSYSEEIRQYADLIAQKWNLADSGVFQTKATRLVWNEQANEWVVDLEQSRESQGAPQRLTVRSQFVVLANGVLNWPKLPDIPGILDFEGHTFHTSRWDYNFTGGSPSQTNPKMSNLKDKRVAIVGTGATAVALVPQLAHWSKHLYVFQRTPASISPRKQWETDPEWFRKEVATGPGWQRQRLQSFNDRFTSGPLPEVDLIADGWSTARTMAVLAGDPAGPSTPDELPSYFKKLNEMDLPRLNKIRAFVDAEVKDKEIAEQLKPWYPTWCKRPCFHEDYLPSFNRDNVTLVDTLGKGLERLTADSIVIGGKSYPVDVVVFATGYRAPFIGTPAEKANVTILGRNGASMSEAWTTGGGPATLHGVVDHNFPNLFLSGPYQAALSGANVMGSDLLAKHAAYILKEVQKRVGQDKTAGTPFSIAATKDAAETWAQEVMSRALGMAALAGCTPGYYNVENELAKLPPEIQMVMARSTIWGRGIEDWATVLEEWRAAGDIKGIEITV